MAEHPMRAAARRIRQAAPAEFAAFLTAFEAYTIETCREVINCDPGMLMRIQGCAMQCEAIFRTLNECHIEKTKPEVPVPQ